MFENFTFQTSPEATCESVQLREQEDDISPLAKDTSNIHFPSAKDSSAAMTPYFSPPPSPPFITSSLLSSSRQRGYSITTSLQSLNLQDAASLSDSTPRFVSNDINYSCSLSSPSDFTSCLSVRKQRQNMMSWQIDDSKRKTIADLVEDMVHNELDCLVVRRATGLASVPIARGAATVSSCYLSPESSDGEIENNGSINKSIIKRPKLSKCSRGHSDGSIRKYWTMSGSIGSLAHGSCGTCGRGVMQKKVRMRKGLANMTDGEKTASTTKSRRK